VAASTPDETFDLVVIGSGPGGYVAAIRAAQLGLKTACVEREKALGGTCLRVGCIPSKALLESSERFDEAKRHLGDHGIQVSEVGLDLAKMLKRKDRIVGQLTGGVDGLFKKNKVTKVIGHGRLDGPGRVLVMAPDGKERVLGAKDIIIATGSVVSTLRGVAVDGDRIGGSTEALAYPEVPEHLIVIGAGVIGLELGSVWLRLGAKVTVLEYLDRILPGIDLEVAQAAQKAFTRQGFEFKLGARVTGARVDPDGQCTVEAEGMEPLRGDRVLVAVGRRPYTEDLGLESVGITLDPRGRIPTDPHFRTKAEHVYAIGDVIAGPMLAHKASEEGVACVERLATGSGHINYDAIPNVVYTNPEVASVGRSEEELKQAGVAYRKGSFLFQHNGRAKALNTTEGFVKFLADERTDRILGVHIFGPRAGDVIAEVAVAIEFGASAEDVARCVHAHPTLSEVVKEAALAVDGRPIHI
jgi:dihydrolipoamide dehydrogenase